MVHSQHYVIPEVNDKNPNTLWNLDKSDFPLNSANTSLLKNKQKLNKTQQLPMSNALQLLTERKS